MLDFMLIYIELNLNNFFKKSDDLDKIILK